MVVEETGQSDRDGLAGEVGTELGLFAGGLGAQGGPGVVTTLGGKEASESESIHSLG
jgi:hypothetical protein